MDAVGPELYELCDQHVNNLETLANNHNQKAKRLLALGTIATAGLVEIPPLLGASQHIDGTTIGLYAIVLATTSINKGFSVYCHRQADKERIKRDSFAQYRPN